MIVRIACVTTMCALACLSTWTAQAQEPPRWPQGSGKPQTSSGATQLVSSEWQKFCGTGQAPHAKRGCLTHAYASAEAGARIVVVALIERDGDPTKILKVKLPGPLQLKYGVRISIDRQAPLNTSSIRCFSKECLTEFEATLDLIGQLKTGQLLTIQSVNISGDSISVSLPLAGFAIAYEEPQSPDPPQTRTDAPLFNSQWSKFCRKDSLWQVCSTGMELRNDADEPIAAAVLIESVWVESVRTESPRSPKNRLKVTLPGSLQLQHGARIIVDRQPPSSTTSITCVAKGCLADFEATPDLINQLKNGQLLNVEAIDISGNSISVALPLTGFAKAYESTPRDPKELDPERPEYWKKRRFGPKPDVVL